MRFSLVVATLHRTEPLGVLLASVARSPEAAAGGVQVIVADQNPDQRLDAILAPHRASLHVCHIRCEPGLSRARNRALREATGEFVAFPDDDCVYNDRTLSTVSAFFESNPKCAGFSGRALDLTGRPYLLRWPTEPEEISKERVWRQAISFSFFLRREVVERVGKFDETLGLGSGTRWGSGEETDYLLRALKCGFRLRYEPTIEVQHPATADRFNPWQRERAYQYARGMGRVLKLHDYPGRTCLHYVLRAAMGSAWWAGRGRMDGARYYAKVARGRLEGWLAS